MKFTCKWTLIVFFYNTEMLRHKTTNYQPRNKTILYRDVRVFRSLFLQTRLALLKILRIIIPEGLYMIQMVTLSTGGIMHLLQKSASRALPREPQWVVENWLLCWTKHFSNLSTTNLPEDPGHSSCKTQKDDGTQHPAHYSSVWNYNLRISFMVRYLWYYEVK